MFRLLTIVTCCLLQQAPPDDPAAPAGEQPPAQPKFREILDESKKLGPWEQNAPLEAEAIGQVFDRNGWNAPEDQFARDLVLRVNRIPPWNQQERQEMFIGALAERYTLSSDQQRRLNRSMQRESLRMTLNHFSQIAPIAMEAVKTRAAGQPFSSEQVARWTTVIRPIAEEGREAIERVSRELARDMNPEQKAALDKDLRALIRRHRTVTQQMVKWENGEWKAEDWGLDRDPIQSGQRQGAASAPAEDSELAAAKAAAQRSLRGGGGGAEASGNDNGAAARMAPPAAEHEWARYVREFAARNEFTNSQRVSAQGILKDMLTRAQHWREANRPRIAAVEARIRANGDPAGIAKLSAELDQLNAPLRAMFEELKGRIEALLTAEQRGKAGQ